MNIDLLPFNAFALESCGTAGANAGAAQTLTLQLELGPVLPCHEPMTGTARAVPGGDSTASGLRAAIIPVSSEAITITFA